MSTGRLRIGLTGGIGSGKTTVSNRFAELGVDVIDADVIAHEITAPGQPLLQAIADEFGSGTLREDGSLDRVYLRQEVFSDASKRTRLESLLHPIIRKRMEQLANDAGSPYCILSIPLLVESKNPARVDRVLVVDAPDDRRREWIKARNGLSDSQIDAVFSAQASREERLAVADDVIFNDGTLKDLADQVEELHQRYSTMATARS